MQLFPKPHAVATAFAGLRDINAAISLLNACQAASGGNVVTFELMPKAYKQCHDALPRCDVTA